MTKPGSIIPPQPGWWIRNSRAGTIVPTYGWNGFFSGNIPLVYGAKPSILLPNMGNHLYPILLPLRQAMAGGKVLTRPHADEYGDPGIGARTKIYIPNPANRTYPLLRPFRIGSPILLATTTIVTYSDTGAGLKSTASSGSYSHTISGNKIVFGVYINTNGGTLPTMAASVGGAISGGSIVGGTPMTLQGTLTPTSIAGCYFAIFALQSPPTGVQTINFVSSIFGNIAANSVSYNGSLGGFGSMVSLSGSGSSFSHSVSANPNQIIFQMFGDNEASVSITAYNQTTRWNAAGSGSNFAAVIGDALGPATFTATDTSATGYGSVAIPVL